MMYKKIIAIIIFASAFSASAQTNLVPNWSFEDTVSCPQIQGLTFISYTPPWFSPTANTPDLFNECSSFMSVGIPINWNGYQQAHTGNGYSGFSWNNNSNCDYLSVRLKSSLKAGRKYCVSLFVNPGNYTYYVIDAVGAYLSTDSIYENNFGMLPYIPQIENPLGQVISDTVGWTEISGEYIAIGGEQFITIGCFRPDSMVQLAYNDTLNGWWPYYYLDDVSVYYCGPDTIEYPNELTITNAFTPNNDSYNDNFAIHGQNIKSVSGKIFNRWGQELFTFSKPEDSWDGKYKGNDVSEGVYFYVISVTFTNGEIQEKHGSIQLIR